MCSISIQFLRFTPEVAGSSSTKELTMSATLQLGTLAVVAVASLCSPATASYSYDGWAHASSCYLLVTILCRSDARGVFYYDR